MPFTIDPNLYTQIGLDSGSLTMLGSIVHSLQEPGQYRVAVHHGETVEKVCFVTADNNSPAAQVTIDLASTPPGTAAAASDCGCGSSKQDSFTVNPRGYVLFRVSGGSGGYYAHVRRIDADVKDRGYDTRTLNAGDLFSAAILRPGTYSVSNTLTRATGEIVVSYPQPGERPYVPPPPVRVICGPNSLEPARLQIQPGQAVIFEARTATRIVIRLERPDDGPRAGQPAPRPGLQRTALK